jgi:LCP family protein required for cell wall assembly
MRRHPLLRLLVGIPVAGVLIAALATAGWLALGRPSIASGAYWFQVTKTGASDFYPSPDKTFFFLALGDDNRESCDNFQGLGDAIHVIGVNPSAHQATIINIPRDTTAPGGDKINAYYSLQGLPGIVAQLNQMMGIQIQYSVTTNFCLFTQMIDSIGGVDVNVTVPMHDTDSGSDFNPGVHHMDGYNALAFSRDRHSLTAGDIDRTGNQTVVLLAALAKMRSQASDAGTIGLAANLLRRVKTDSVSISEAFRLFRFALSFDPATVRSVTPPVGTSGTSTNLIITPAARSIFADFADDAVLQTH